MKMYNGYSSIKENGRGSRDISYLKENNQVLYRYVNICKYMRISIKTTRIFLYMAYAAVIFFIISEVHCDISMKELDEVQRTIIKHFQNGKMILINPDGPLSLLGVHMNKHILKRPLDKNALSSTETVNTQKIEENRKMSTVEDCLVPDMDVVDNTQETTSNKHIPERVKTTEVVPPPDNLSINSFTQFLEYYKNTNEISYSIIAILLILSEGLDIPLRFENEDSYLVLFNNMEEKKIIFRINMSIVQSSVAHTNPNKKARNAVYKKGAVKYIKFFMQGEKQHGEEKPNAQLTEPFDINKFINSQRWHIQNYIWNYISSGEELLKIIRNVYCILIEIAKNSELVDLKIHNSVIMTVLSNCFVTVHSYQEVMYNFICLSKFEILLDNHRVQLLPFRTKRDVSVFSCIQIPNSRNSMHNRLGPEKIHSCIESALLNLFLCFAFDVRTGVYDISHIENANSDLMAFFKVYTTPKKVNEKEDVEDASGSVNYSTSEDYTDSHVSSMSEDGDLEYIGPSAFNNVRLFNYNQPSENGLQLVPELPSNSNLLSSNTDDHLWQEIGNNDNNNRNANPERNRTAEIPNDFMRENFSEDIRQSILEDDLESDSEKATTNAFNHWVKIVSNIDDAGIWYKKEGKYGISLGILNMLRVIIHLTKSGNKELKEIAMFVECLKSPPILQNLYDLLEKYIERIFIPLFNCSHQKYSKNKIPLKKVNISVKLSNIENQFSSIPSIEIYGDLTITYTYDDISASITISCRDGHAITSYKSQKSGLCKVKYNDAKTMQKDYINKNTFAGYTLWEYINQEIEYEHAPKAACSSNNN
ncbi:hypothetical protein NEQG_00771 [Nematocida parisii ERTm3]|uniref:Uncharacterized protein n=1 Tax=Nematocida parisii (strain ERTm3) TaxID=935791 RepID=I3EIA5_NEMP3|nr:hypothetical protein NEQG_00771 [Nematocida parisii ERTm3]